MVLHTPIQENQEINGEIILQNTTDKPQRIKFNLREAIYACSEDRVFSKTNAHAQSATSWFNSPNMEKELGANEKYTYRYTIDIPADENIKGSFWTVLMVSIENPIKEDIINKNIGIGTKIRYGVGLLTHVNELDDVNLNFQNINLNEGTSTKEKSLDVTIKNDGSFIERVALTLEVYDSHGNKVTELKTKSNLIFPNVCFNYTVDLSSLPPGKYECLLLADSREEFTGTNLTLSIDKKSSQKI